MAWEFIHVVRRTYQSDDNWGELHIMNAQGKWERLCYTYELPWETFSTGQHAGKSKNNFSRIKIGQYDMKPRADGPKGWRLELQKTGHRSNIQIHRAHASMFIQGCILPVTFNNLSVEALKKGDPLIQTQSVGLMNKIKARYEQLKNGKDGNPTVNISANLPAKANTPGTPRYA